MRDRPYSWIFAAVLVLVGLSIALTGSVAAQSADLVVATDGSGDHTSIQNAINSASDSDRIEIQSGMYGESINIDKNITLFTSGVVNISNQSDISDSTAISISNGAEPEIIGVHVIGWRYGIKYDFSETDWRVRNVTISDVDRGIQSYGSSGDWRVTNTIIETNDVGISMNENTGNPTVVNTEIEGLRSDDGTGIIASDTSGDPVIRSVKTTNVGPGVRFYQSTGNWTIESSTFIDLREDSVGIDATESAGSWTIEDTMIENTTGEDGVDADDTEGNWIIENITVKNIGKIGIDAENANAPNGPVIRDATINETDEEGIDIAGSRSDVLITETIVRNTGKGEFNNGIRVEEALGDWTIEDTIIENISGEGIDVYNQPASSQATIRNVTVTDTQNHGVNFYNSSGDWKIIDSNISNSDNKGVEAGDTTGKWNITSTTIDTTTNSLIGASGAAGSWVIEDTVISNGGGDGIDLSDTSGDWVVADSTVKSVTDSAITAYNSTTTSSATVRNMTIQDVRFGVNFYQSKSDWEVVDSTVSGASNESITAAETEGEWSVTQSSFPDGKDSSQAIYAVDATTTGNASYNYWGASDGPSGDFSGSGGSAVGNVNVTPYYTDASLTTLSSEQGADDGTDQGSTGFVDVAASDLAGSGTAADPYVITNASELQAMEDDLDAHYELGGDIDASATAQWNNQAGFDPIGDGSEDFSGDFDGTRHTISGLTINRDSSAEQVGLFGEVDSALIESVHLDSVKISGNNSVGALAGYLEEDATIQNASMNGSVSGTTETGGLIGSNTDSTMKFASAKGTVTGSDQIGGLVGQNVGGVVTQGSSQATVTATGEEQGGDSARGGGLVGGNFNHGIINNSYATGNVTGGKAGGITGENYDGSRVANTYAAGNVDGRNDRSTGGVSGENFESCPFQNEQQCEGFEASTITDSYWDTEATGQSTSAGDAAGLTTSEMTGSAAETNMAAFEFGSIWQTQPDGYPILVQQADDKSDQSGSAQVQLSSVTLTPQSVDSASESTHQLSFEAQNISADGNEDDFDITFPDKVELVSYSDVEIDEKSSNVNKVDNTLEFSVDPTGGGSMQISGELNVTVSATN